MKFYTKEIKAAVILWLQKEKSKKQKFDSERKKKKSALKAERFEAMRTEVFKTAFYQRRHDIAAGCSIDSLNVFKNLEVQGG